MAGMKAKNSSGPIKPLVFLSQLLGKGDIGMEMALVDVSTYFPEIIPAEKTDRYSESFCNSNKSAGPKTGLWWDILNFPDRKGNYLASASSMSGYAIAKVCIDWDTCFQTLFTCSGKS